MWMDILWVSLAVVSFGLAIVISIIGVFLGFIANNPWKILAVIAGTIATIFFLKKKKVGSMNKVYDKIKQIKG